MRIILPASIVAAVPGAVSVSAADSRPPNIVVILADDQGYADISLNPHHPAEVSTPNMDALAQDGVVFSQAYTSSQLASTRSGGWSFLIFAKILPSRRTSPRRDPRPSRNCARPAKPGYHKCLSHSQQHRVKSPTIPRPIANGSGNNGVPNVSDQDAAAATLPTNEITVPSEKTEEELPETPPSTRRGLTQTVTE